jgi:hypothetical protein
VWWQRGNCELLVKSVDFAGNPAACRWLNECWQGTFPLGALRADVGVQR